MPQFLEVEVLQQLLLLSDHRGRRLPRSELLPDRLHLGLPLARRRHLPHRNHRGERSGRSLGHRNDLPLAHRQTNGRQKLFGQELGGRRNARIYIDHLLAQDRSVDPEPNDRRAHVVQRSGGQR